MKLIETNKKFSIKIFHVLTEKLRDIFRNLTFKVILYDLRFEVL